MLDRVTLIVVTFNSAHCLPNLAELLQQCPHVIISDNGSHDGTAQAALRMAPHANILAHPHNLGFGAANNRALQQVQTPFAFLINPDCLLSAESLKQLLIHAAQYPQAAIVAPQLLKSNGQPDINYRWPHLYWSPQGPQADGPVSVGFVCGAAMLFRLASFADIGFFDEDFFLYYEDDDLCLRLFQKQREIIVLPHIVATHHNRGSVKGSTPLRNEYLRGFHHAQSKLIYASKHQSIKKAHQKRRRLLWLTAMILPLRFMAFSPKLLARMWGRLHGLIKWTHPKNVINSQ